MADPKPNAQMPPPPTAPRRKLPAGAWDAHVHLLAGMDEFPLWEGRAENPALGPDFDGWLELYRAHLAALGATRGLIVHSIFYGTDNSVTRAALARLGPDFKGVGLLPDGAPEADMADFAEAGMVAVRLNYVHGGVLSWEGAKAMAPALAAHGLHIQMLLHADTHMTEIADDIRALPVPLVIDHLGWPAGALDPASEGFQTLCALMAEGHVYTKLSAPYRMCPAPYAEVAACTRALIDANREQCLWGSDWPHVMLNGAEMPSAAALLDAADALIPDDATRQRIFTDNPTQLFG